MNKTSLVKMGGKLPGKLPGLLGPMTNIFNSLIELKKITAQEKTNREKIKAEKKIIIEKIRAEKEVMLTYIEGSFAERRKNFDALFEALDKTIEKNNIEAINLVLHTIETTVKTNPLLDYKNFRENLLDENKEIEV